MRTALQSATAALTIHNVSTAQKAGQHLQNTPCSAIHAKRSIKPRIASAPVGTAPIICAARVPTGAFSTAELKIPSTEAKRALNFRRIFTDKQHRFRISKFRECLLITTECSREPALQPQELRAAPTS